MVFLVDFLHKQLSFQSVLKTIQPSLASVSVTCKFEEYRLGSNESVKATVSETRRGFDTVLKSFKLPSGN